jgi:hydrogenase expression/formation protein HypD
MKFVDEFRNASIARELTLKIKQAIVKIDRPIYLMEVCGTHTMAIFRHGIKNILPSSLKLLSGPGCPVCVTPGYYINQAIALAHQKNVTICSFGDMLQVPGSRSTLSKERAKGADVRAVYSPLDALHIAEKDPQRNIIFLAVGFETTVPTIAGTLLEAKEKGISNFFISSAHKLIPPAMKLLVQDKEIKIDGFICPAHVSAIIGSNAYHFLAKDYGMPCVIIGFEPLDILHGILMLLNQILAKDPRVEIQYARIVKHQGNTTAIGLINEFFEKTDSRWRGFGIIPESGLAVAKVFAHFDATKVFPADVEEAEEHPGCICGDVLKGKRSPEQCDLFRRFCTPTNPVGACMVSQEGTCAAYYKYGEH